MSWLVFLKEKLSLVIAFWNQIDPLVCSVNLHKALDAKILIQNARNYPKLPLNLLSSLTGQIGLSQNLLEHFAFAFNIVRFECSFKWIEFQKVLAFHLLIVEEVRGLRQG